MFEKHLIQWLLRPRMKWILPTIIAVITVAFAAQLPKLRFNFELEQLFPQSDPDLQFFEAHIERFGYDNDFISILLISENGIFNEEYLATIRETCKQLTGIDHVLSIWNPLDLKRLNVTSYGLVAENLFELPSNFQRDSTIALNDPWLSESFGYQQFLPIALSHEHIQDQETVRNLQEEIEAILGDQPYKYHVLGKIWAQEEFNKYIRIDFGRFLSLSVVICLIVLIVIFRDLRATLLPLIICSISLVWVFGLMALTITPVSIVTSLIPPLILFISSSDAVHLLSALKRKGSKKLAYEKVLFPTFLTSATTSLGFLSIAVIPVAPVSELGLFCGIGSVFAFLITYGLAPLLNEKPADQNRQLEFQPFWLWVQRHEKAILTAFLVIGTLGVYGSFQLETDAYLLRDLPKTSTSRQAFDYGDQYLQGSKPWAMEITLANPEYNIWDPVVQSEIHKITSYLEEDTPLSSIRSTSKVLAYINHLRTGEFTTPHRNNRSFAEAQSLLRRQNFQLVSADKKHVRITALIPELGSKATRQMNQAIMGQFERSIDPKIINYKVTGTNYLIDKSNGLLASYMLKSLLLAISLVSILLGLYFRSLWVLVVSLAPNLLPLLLVGGLVHLLGIPIQFSTSIIFALTFGIVVDDTIHFLTTFRRTEGPVDQRILSTLNTAGAGILNTTLILISGFAIMMASNFGATFYLGLFLACSMVLALATDLMLLPLLLKSLNRGASNKL